MHLSKYIRWAKFYFSNIPFYIIFYVTSRCNAKCAHCFNWKLLEESPNRKELSLEEIESIAKNWGDILIANLAGGEPYLRKDLPEIVRILKKYSGVEIIAIPSNGLLTDGIIEIINKLLKDFPELYFRFTFSVDGVGDMHNKIRGIPNGFDKVVETIKQVKKFKEKYNNFSLFTNSCFMQLNQDILIDTLEFIKEELDVDVMSVTYIRGDVKSDEAKQNLYNEKYKKIINYLSLLNRNNFKSHPLSNFIWGATAVARDKVFENLKTNKRNFECYAIRKMIVIDDIGEVKICEMLPTSLGNLRDYDYNIKNILTTDFANAEYEKIKNHKCNCTWECAIRTGIIYNPKEYLSIFKYVFKK